MWCAHLTDSDDRCIRSRRRRWRGTPRPRHTDSAYNCPALQAIQTVIMLIVTHKYIGAGDVKFHEILCCFFNPVELHFRQRCCWYAFLPCKMSKPIQIELNWSLYGSGDASGRFILTQYIRSYVKVELIIKNKVKTQKEKKIQNTFSLRLQAKYCATVHLRLCHLDVLSARPAHVWPPSSCSPLAKFVYSCSFSWNVQYQAPP